MKFIKVLLLISLALDAQNFIRLEDVPEKFASSYLQEDHDWNPLWVGNLWQYSKNEDKNEIDVRYIEKDTVVNGLTYYKKVDFLGDSEGKFFLWERNDWIAYSSYMLDIDDINENGYTNEELLLDSLEVDDAFYEYTSYRFAYTRWKDIVWNKPTQIRVSAPEWYKVFDDTVLVRKVEYLDLFITEYIADQYGVIIITGDFFVQTLIAARIYGEEYGLIVSANNIDMDETPKELALSQNYPNPFNPVTNINYYVSKTADVKLEVYNSLGEKIETLVDQQKQPGYYDVVFNAEDLPSGIYFYVIKDEKHHQVKKMCLIK